MPEVPTPEVFREENGWLIDARDNRASIAYFGGRAEAETSLRSLIDCDRCVNCSRCSRCSGCSRCSRCSGCSDCSDCSDCSGLWAKTGARAADPGEANHGPPPVPLITDIHKTIHAAASSPGALDMGNWHACEKTHCRAGWAVALAGTPGFALEQFYGGEGPGTTLAAMMIYDASDPAFKINPCRFFDDNTDALADMARMAGVEA